MNKTRDQLAEERSGRNTYVKELMLTPNSLAREVLQREADFKAGWDAHAERAKVLVDDFERLLSAADREVKKYGWEAEPILSIARDNAKESLASYRGEE